MQALVTGGAGFIGSHLVEGLVADGHSVVVLDDLSSGSLENLAAVRNAITVVDGDICQSDSYLPYLPSTHWVFHLAAKTSVNESFQLAEAYRTINAQATDTLLYESAKAGVKRVVISSTCAVYGDIGTVAASESLLTQPKSPYAVTKLQNELAADFYSQTMGLQTIALRYFNVYGSRQQAESQYSSVLSKFIACYQAKMSPLLFGDGLQTRDFIHVSDIVQANLLAAKAALSPNMRPQRVFNVGTGHAITVLALLQAVSDAFGYTLPVTFNPARQGDIRHSVASITAAQSVLGFAPKVTVDAGIRGLVEEALKQSMSSLPVSSPGVLSASGL